MKGIVPKTAFLFGLGVALCALPGLSAANRIFIDNQTVKIGDTGVVIPIRADHDDDLYGFQLSIKFDPAKLSLVDVTTAAAVFDNAPYSNGRWSPDPAVPDAGVPDGTLQWGLVTDMSKPLSVVIPAGVNQVLLNLKVDVLATAAGTSNVTPQDNIGPQVGAWLNLFTKSLGATIVPTLQAGTITIQEQTVAPQFRRGDIDGNTKIEVTDAIGILGHLFLGDNTAWLCAEAADTDNSGTVDVTDAVTNLNFQFLGGTPPANPGPRTCGPDEGVVFLGCDAACQ